MEFEKKIFNSTGTAEIKGNSFPYRAITENFPVVGKSGVIDASMYTTAYERSDVEDYDGRPVLFAWNGGPGCGSVFVHMGLLSPKIVDTGTGADMKTTPPFRMINNDNCLLDVCDLVVVDAIEVGYSRLLNQDKKSEYCTTESDAIAFVQCIRAWMSANKRWNSPIYIMGESYGTIRAALVADYFFYHNIGYSAGSPFHISGIIMVGTALNYGQPSFPIPNSVLSLPTIAATNWYWNPEDKGKLEDYVDECSRFAFTDYVKALALGKACPDNEKQRIAEVLSGYSGYSREELLKRNLSIDEIDFSEKCMAAGGKTVGLYDTRVCFEKIKYADKKDIFADDPSNQVITPAFTSVFNGEWKDKLNINLEEEYVEFGGDVGNLWDLKTAVSPIHSLEKAMYRNPDMKLMFAVGYYDLTCTLGWVQYLVNHYNLPEERTFIKCYEAGHMTYIGTKQAFKFEEELKEFILK